MKKYLRPRYIIPAAILGLVILCFGVYSGIRSYAPVAAQEVPTVTPTPFLPAVLSPTPFSPLATELLGTLQGPAVLPATSTPFLDLPPWSPYAGPIYPAMTPIPTPVPEFDQGEDVMNVVLLGSDQRPYGGSNNTDTMMILSLNKAKKTAVLISIPRDLYVYIPAHGMDRVNAAFATGGYIGYPGGGFALFRDTIKYNFGITVDHYALMYFWGFKDMIDALGGIDVYADYTITDRRQGYGDYTMPAGMNHMTGETALWYVRARKTSSDFDRTRRQQEVLVGITQKLLNLNALGNIPGFFVTLSNYVESDLTLDAITPYVDLAASVSPSSIPRYGMDPPYYCRNWWTPDGKSVYLPDYDAIPAMLSGALNP